MMGDIPSISNIAHSHNTYNTGSFVGAAGGGGAAYDQATLYQQAVRAQNQAQAFGLFQQASATPKAPAIPKSEEPMAQSNRRYVQVFIADPDENVPLDRALIYRGEPKMTDLNDQELFFEIDIKSVLDSHNSFRKTVVNKSVKERTEYLDAARIRDLKMTVVDIATF